MINVVLIPVKRLCDAKGRLAGVLDGPARQRLTLAMLEDMLGTLLAGGVADKVMVCTPDAALLRWLRWRHPRVAGRYSEGNLNAVCNAAIAQFPIMGFSHLTILHGDLPRVAPEDLAALCGAPADNIILACDRHGTGTNAIHLPLPSRFQTMFGPGSLQRHLLECKRLGLGCEVLSGTGLSWDLDTPEDLAQLTLPQGGRTRQILEKVRMPFTV
ncbi:2-phospho-L-lactate guanylyltransferase [Clostridia bacterium OttesenSCG-928-O13]|nr:2-phospho-L-lactate guanylyltransferase [Clostridia bacterium OttesenSCG-928-O13]